MMPQLFFRSCLPLFAALLLGSCQRATYSFQAVEVRAEAPGLPGPGTMLAAQVVPAGPATAAAVVTKLPRHRPPRHRGQAAARRLARLLPLAGPPQAVAAQSFSISKTSAQPRAEVLPGRQRSRAVAIVLAVLSCTYLPFSLHNFYLGYYGRGVAAIALLLAGVYLLALGSLGIVFGPTGLAAVGYVGIALLAGWFFWQLTDLFRICRGDLKPRGGKYHRRVSVPDPAIGAPVR